MKTQYIIICKINKSGNRLCTKLKSCLELQYNESNSKILLSIFKQKWRTQYEKKICISLLALALISATSLNAFAASTGSMISMDTSKIGQSDYREFKMVVDDGKGRGTSAPSTSNVFPLNKGDYSSTVKFDSNIYTDYYMTSSETGKIYVTTDVKAYTNKECTTADSKATYSFTVWLICSDGTKQSKEHNVNASTKATFTVDNSKKYYIKLSNPTSQYSKTWVKGDFKVTD